MYVNTNYEIHILMGLPGSGKSTFAKDFKNKKHRCQIIDFDEMMAVSAGRNPSKHIKAQLKGKISFGAENLILDGLFLSSDAIVETVCTTMWSLVEKNNNSYLFQMKKAKDSSVQLHVSIIIHRWDEDRETCLKNDGGRRSKDSAITILNAVYEMPDLELIKDKISGYASDIGCKIIGIEQVNHKVELKEDWKRYYNSYGIHVDDDGNLRSEEWSKGGTCGSCWDSNLSHVSGEKTPNFDELDEFLERISPNITFLQYKKIWKECVWEETETKGDYYGGSITYAWWVCNLEGMHTLLEEFGYTSKEE